MTGGRWLVTTSWGDEALGEVVEAISMFVSVVDYHTKYQLC